MPSARLALRRVIGKEKRLVRGLAMRRHFRVDVCWEQGNT